MNEKTSTTTETTNTLATFRPCTTFYHANGKGTGSAIRFELIPARFGEDGYILATLAPQTNAIVESPSFDWSAVSVRLYRDDLAEIIQVIHGTSESIADGKGIFHRFMNENKIIKFSHIFEPFPGYSLNLNNKKDGSSDYVSFRFVFTTSEALALMMAIEHAMIYVCFGVPAND